MSIQITKGIDLNIETGRRHFNRDIRKKMMSLNNERNRQVQTMSVETDRRQRKKEKK